MMRSTGTSGLKVVDGLIVEEIGLDDRVTVLQLLDLIKRARVAQVHARRQVCNRTIRRSAA
jgi:hypothetical protein